MDEPRLNDGHDLAKDRDPWERMPRETMKAYNAFLLYRDQGPMRRSVRIVARELHRSTRLIARWSAGWKWVFRAEQWDAYRASLRVADEEQLQRESRLRIRAAAQAVLLRAVECLLGRKEQPPSEQHPQGVPAVAPMDPSKLSGIAVARMLQAGAQLELLTYDRRGSGPSGSAAEPESDTDTAWVARVLSDPVAARKASEFFASLDRGADPARPADAGDVGEVREP